MIDVTRYVIDLWGDRGKFLVDCPWGSDDGPPHPRATPDPGKAMHFSDRENARVIIDARLKDYPAACVRKLVGRWEVDATASAGPANLAAERQAERDASDLRREVAAIKAELAKHPAWSSEYKWWMRRLVETRLRLGELDGATEADQAEADEAWLAKERA